MPTTSQPQQPGFSAHKGETGLRDLLIISQDPRKNPVSERSARSKGETGLRDLLIISKDSRKNPVSERLEAQQEIYAVGVCAAGLEEMELFR